MPVNGILTNDHQHINYQFSKQTCPAVANTEQVESAPQTETVEQPQPEQASGEQVEAAKELVGVGTSINAPAPVAVEPKEEPIIAIESQEPQPEIPEPEHPDK